MVKGDVTCPLPVGVDRFGSVAKDRIISKWARLDSGWQRPPETPSLLRPEPWAGQQGTGFFPETMAGER